MRFALSPEDWGGGEGSDRDHAARAGSLGSLTHCSVGGGVCVCVCVCVCVVDSLRCRR